MAYLDTLERDHKSTPSTDRAAPTAYLDLGRIETKARPPIAIEIASHRRHTRQMLLAAALASAGILAVAAAMMLRLF